MSLIINNLSVIKNDRTVAQDISFSVEPGKVTAILGANGAGKSEVVLAIAGMLTISSGSVIVEGHDITHKAPNVVRAAGVAAVPEGHRVLTNLTVDENFRAAGALHSADLKENLKKNYQRFPELAALTSQLAGTLSGGQQQMVALGHALMSNPKYLLIDELSLGLAPLVVKRLMSVVDELKSNGTGIILIEQFTDMALDIAEEAVVLRTGKMHYAGDASSLRSDTTLLDNAYFGTR